LGVSLLGGILWRTGISFVRGSVKGKHERRIEKSRRRIRGEEKKTHFR
jgi:hypothetical protein